jgi:TolA-binding protein
VDKAITDLNKIINDYKYDILSDDAMFLLAKIYDEKKNDKGRAMEYYKQILKDYPGSIYGAQSRIKFRELRGDFVN